jgi:rhodanese-related sulfurtransferase
MKTMKIITQYILIIFIVILNWSCTDLEGAGSPPIKTSDPLEANSKDGILIEVNPEELLKVLKYDKNVFIIDIRNQEAGLKPRKSISESFNVNESEKYCYNSGIPKDKSIILLSKSGKAGHAVGKYLANKGYSVYNLEQGMEFYWSWREEILRKSLNIYDREIDVIELYADDFGC